MQSLIYCFSMFFIRLTVLLLYHRIFLQRRAIYITTSAVVGITIGSVFTSIFQCTPIRYSWNKEIEGYCLDSNKHYIGGPMTSFLLDLIILILPLPPIWRLQLSAREKLRLMLILCVGGLWVRFFPSIWLDSSLVYNVDSTCFSAVIREPYFIRHQSSDFSCVC